MSTYDYSLYKDGQNYIFGKIDDNQAYLTGQGGNLNVGDCLILKLNSQIYYYQIKQIDYYSNPDDMWIALVHKVDSTDIEAIDPNRPTFFQRVCRAIKAWVSIIYASSDPK